MTGPSATLPATWAPLEAALRQRRPVWVSYHGLRRLVCPHALGWKSGRALVLAYQSGGQTTNGALAADPRKRWRCLFVDELDDVAVDWAAKWESASNYNHSRPFSAIDHVAVAVPADPPDGS
jgi:hypothetical protein